MPAIDPTAFAAELLNSCSTRQIIPAPPSSIDEGFTLETAYTVEAEFSRLRQEAGRTVTGRKVGYANKAMWRALKLETLVWASMYDDTMQYGKSLDVKSFIDPRLEPEIVFKLKQSMPADLDAAGALGYVEWLAVGFEIIDCPFPGWQFKPADFVAAFGLHRALVVGETTPVTPESIPALVNELATFKLKLLRDGQMVEEGAGKNSLKSPALCLAELAGAALRRNTPLQAGELISTGTLTAAPSIKPNDLWAVELEGLSIPNFKLNLV